MEGEGGGDEEEKEGGGGGGEAALGAASVEGESEGEESIRSQSGMWIIQGRNISRLNRQGLLYFRI